MADTGDPRDKKEKLSTELERTEELASICQEKFQGWLEQMQFVKDLARAEKEFLTIIPDDTYVRPERWNREIEAWHGTNQTLGTIGNELTKFPTFSNTIWPQAVSATGFVAESTLAKPFPEKVQIEMPATLKRFNDVVERLQPLGTAERELIRLGLDTAPLIEKSPVALLKEASNAYLRPPSRETYPLAVLVPLRECINGTLNHLLRRCPGQEPAKGPRRKVLSILRRAATPGVETGVIERLADDVEEVIDALSESKQHQMTREDIYSRLTKGTMFLAAFLQLVDESKLRK